MAGCQYDAADPADVVVECRRVRPPASRGPLRIQSPQDRQTPAERSAAMPPRNVMVSCACRSLADVLVCATLPCGRPPTASVGLAAPVTAPLPPRAAGARPSVSRCCRIAASVLVGSAVSAVAVRAGHAVYGPRCLPLHECQGRAQATPSGIPRNVGGRTPLTMCERRRRSPGRQNRVIARRVVDARSPGNQPGTTSSASGAAGCSALPQRRQRYSARRCATRRWRVVLSSCSEQAQR